MKVRTILPCLSLFCTAALLLACGNTTEGQTNDTKSAGDTVPVTASVTEAETRVKADLPDKDFNGETFTFYGRIYDGDWSADDILSHKQDGEVINDALYDRTCYLEETYNVKLDVIESGGDGHVAASLKTLLLGGDTSFQSIVCDVADAATLSTEHMLWDLYKVEFLDFSQPWWSQKANNTMSIANRLYYATGDIFIVDNRAIRMVFFNKDMIAQFDLTSPYTLVDENQWTVDKLVAYSRAVQGDLNGDNKITRTEDRFGTMAQGSFGSVLYYAAGESITAKDENDMPVISCTSERAMTVMSGISEMIAGCEAISMSDENTSTDSAWPDNVRHFMAGRVLFAPEVLLFIELARNCSVDIGMLPPPKFDSSQDGYYCYADNWCPNVISVPVTNTEPDNAGFLIEAMAADSLNTLSPAYYEVALTEKYARDAESVKMLDLILDSMVLDNGNIFGWGNLQTSVNDAINRGTAIASTIEKRISATEKAIAKTITAIEEAEG